MALLARFGEARPLHGQQVRVGGLWFGVEDIHGLKWWIEDAPDWEQVALSGESGELAWADGGWLGPQWVGPARFGITLRLDGPYGQRALVEQAFNTLVAELPLRDAIPVVVKTFAATYLVHARCETNIKVKRVTDTHWQVSMLFVATDPVKYAADWDAGGVAWREWVTGLPARKGGLTFPFRFPFVFGGVEEAGAIEFIVSGSAGARGTIEISGPVSGIVVQDTEAGWVFEYGQALGAGETLKVDPYRRMVEVNGASRRGRFSGDWPTFGPGHHRVTWSGIAGSGGSPVLRVRVADIYQ